MPHERLGEGVCVFLVMRDSTKLDMPDLQNFLKETGLAKQKWPERIELRSQLEKTASGKVRKDLLRQQLA